jgi:hypothetical protein
LFYATAFVAFFPRALRSFELRLGQGFNHCVHTILFLAASLKSRPKADSSCARSFSWIGSPTVFAGVLAAARKVAEGGTCFDGEMGFSSACGFGSRPASAGRLLNRHQLTMPPYDRRA